MTSGTPADALRSALSTTRVVHAAGCHDPVTARQVATTGFEVAYLSGSITSAVTLGLPDLGFAGLADMAAHAARVARAAAPVPLVADADTGYGNALHVRHTVERYIEAGVAALHLEDQSWPKRCGHMAGKSVVAADEAAAKIAAALEVAGDDLVVIARTDAASVEGLGSAIERAGRYADAGAHLVFVEGVTAAADLAAVHEALPHAGLMVNASEAAGRVDLPSDDVLAACGVRLVIHPVAAMLASMRATQAVYDRLAATGTVDHDALAAWSDLTDLVGLPDHLATEQRYAT